MFNDLLDYHFNPNDVEKLKGLYVKLRDVGARPGLISKTPEKGFDPQRVFDYITPEVRHTFPWDDSVLDYIGNFGNPGFFNNDCLVHALNNFFRMPYFWNSQALATSLQVLKSWNQDEVDEYLD